MSQTETPGPGGKDRWEYLPSPASLIGAWAGAVDQVWDLTNLWYQTLFETRYVEDEQLVSDSARAYVPQNPNAETFLAYSATRIQEDGIPLVTPVSVTLEPERIAKGTGQTVVTVTVEEPASVKEVLVTLWDRDNPGGTLWPVHVHLTG